ncbi:MAG TPA: antibiotic biosynthesis monooxygenase [Caulobacteraceae bacterium]|jgi:quinol monooxygenase YgiN
MRRHAAWALSVWALGALGLLAAAGRAAAPEPRLMVFYVEAPPTKAASAASALAAEARAARKAGAAAAEVLREAGRPSRMALVEQWPALPGPEAARRAKALAGVLEPGLQAPVDDRLSDPILPLDLKAAPAGAFHVLMHIDVMPDGSATARQALVAQKATVMAARGALGFQAASQTGRPNHFAVHETWKNRAAYEAYAASPAGQALRRRLDRFKGAPFDDRFYGS